jgi:hypothetical protein
MTTRTLLSHLTGSEGRRNFHPEAEEEEREWQLRDLSARPTSIG